MKKDAQWVPSAGDALKLALAQVAVADYSWGGSRSIDDIDHVGIVIKDNHDGTIQTVEGNTDNSVKVRTRDVSSVVGYGYPEYRPATT